MKTFPLLAVWLCAGVVPAFAQVTILHIQVIEGEGAVHAPGSRSLRPLTVEVTSETGKPVEGAAVSFHLPEEGPGGNFGNQLRTDVVITDFQGRASLRSLQVNRTPGPFQIHIVASKEQAHAGVICSQYISDPKGGRGATASTASAAAPAPATSPGTPTASRSRLKWIVLAVAAGGAAAAAAALAGKSNAASTSTAPATTAVTAPTIGAPTITVGKP